MDVALSAMRDEVKLRERHVVWATRDPASEAKIKLEERVQEDLRLLRREE